MTGAVAKQQKSKGDCERLVPCCSLPACASTLLSDSFFHAIKKIGRKLRPRSSGGWLMAEADLL
jgi:hypothetical protein